MASSRKENHSWSLWQAFGFLRGAAAIAVSAPCFIAPFFNTCSFPQQRTGQHALQGSVAQQQVFQGAGEVQEDQRGAGPYQRHVQLLEGGVESFVGGEQARQFVAEELDRIGREGRGQVAGERGEEQEGVERQVGGAGHLGQRPLQR